MNAIVITYDENGVPVIRELIRCKECKYYEKFVNGGGLHFCSNDRIAEECEEPTEEDFCSWAERRER